MSGRVTRIETAAREGMEFWDKQGEEVKDFSDLPFLIETVGGKFPAISAALLTQRDLDIEDGFIVKDLLVAVSVWSGLRAVRKVNEKLGGQTAINLTDETTVALVVDKFGFFEGKIHFFVEEPKQGFTVQGLVNLPEGKLEPGLPDKVVVLVGDRNGESVTFTDNAVTKPIGLETKDVYDVSKGQFTEEGQGLIDFIAGAMLKSAPAGV